jgi:hypothetical protein
LRFKRSFIVITICCSIIVGTIGFSLVFSRGKSQSTEIASDENLALGQSVTVSSSAELAQILVEGQEQPNASWHTAWSPPQVPSRPSWVSIDLGQIQSIQRLSIVFSVAAYEGIYDIWAPPNSIVIEIGDSPHKTYPIETIASENIPDNGACPDKRRLEVSLKKSYHARYVKLVFPNGSKFSLMPDIVGLGEIGIYGVKQTKQKHKTVSIEGAFGRAVIDVNSPQIVDILLREPSGRLAEKSLLSGKIRGVTLSEARDRKIFCRQGAYTYVSDNRGLRFESRQSSSHKIKIKTNSKGEIEKIILTGIRLKSKNGSQGPVEEDWILEKTSTGTLSWTINQRWLEKFTVDISGTPGIYLARFGGWGAYRDRRVSPEDPQITSTVWLAPSHLISGTHSDYETYTTPMTTEYRTHTIDIPNTWAIYKFFTNFHLQSDLRLDVKGGYLFRRAGVRNDFNEIGATVNPLPHFERQPGDISNITLLMTSVDKFATGQQLAVEIPNSVLANTLRDLHASMLNGGVISDPKRYHFGNGTEDANYAGSADFQARALSVSTAVGTLAEHPYNADTAFKGHLEQILATLNNRGLTCFGFNSNCQLLDDNLHVISAAKTYVVKTGDQAFIKKHYATFEQMIDFFIKHLDKKNGLFRSPDSGAHWYYDGISFSGFNTYYQAFLYQALIDMAEMSEIIGKKKNATLRQTQAKRLATAINSFLWYPDAPNGPRYADWIDASGKRATYFIDIAQYPLIAFGIAPPERAKAMLATADQRLSELKKQFGHTRSASLSILWPLSPARGERCFGTYFYGGSLLANTYWEVLARARAGHIDGEWGAYRLLENFAKRFAEISFVGSNAIDIRGNISLGGDEAYLADMLVVPAALVHGLLGVKTNWQEIKVAPAMPSGWEHVQTRLVWKGRLYDIRIEGKQIDIVPSSIHKNRKSYSDD